MSTRLFAVLYDLVMWPAERFCLGRLRRELLSTAGGRILEVGAGTGANLPYYRKGVHLVLSEPDSAMLRRARLAGRPAVLAVAEHLPVADAFFDSVVSTLVQCTVADPAAALAEVRRVLRPGGSFLLLEHVRSPDANTARLQARLTPWWKRLVRGCHLDRDTAAALVAAGFRIESIRHFEPTRIFPLILVRATAPDAR